MKDDLGAWMRSRSEKFYNVYEWNQRDFIKDSM